MYIKIPLKHHLNSILLNKVKMDMQNTSCLPGGTPKKHYFLYN